MTATCRRALPLLGALLAGCAPAVAPAPAAPVDVAQSIVIIDADGTDADPSAPWGGGKTWTRTLTGLAVDGHRILVGGWGLHGQQHVRAQRQGTTAKSPARAILVDADCGLALLTVDDPLFWTGLPPAAIYGGVARQGPARLLHATPDGARVDASEAAVVGLPISGRCNLLHLKLGQVDARHVVPSDVVGSGTQALGVVASSTGDEVLAFTSRTLVAFLAEARRPAYRGFPTLGIHWQSVTSPALRDELGLAPGEGGVRVVHVFPLGSGAGALVAGDVILTIAGKKIDGDGSYDDPDAGRAPFGSMLPDSHHPGDVVDVGVLRDGVRKAVGVTLRAWPGSADLVPWFNPDDPAGAYDIEGGLVFQNLTGDYLTRVFGSSWGTVAPRQLLERYWLDRLEPTPEEARVVVLTRVLADPATLGYERVRDLVVESINGVKPRSLADVRGAFAHPAGAFDVVTFAPGQRVHRIVLDAREAAAATERLRSAYEPPKVGGP